MSFSGGQLTARTHDGFRDKSCAIVRAKLVNVRFKFLNQMIAIGGIGHPIWSGIEIGRRNMVDETLPNPVKLFLVA